MGSGKWEGERKKEEVMLINWLPTHTPNQPAASISFLANSRSPPDTHTHRPAWGGRLFFSLNAGVPAELQV